MLESLGYRVEGFTSSTEALQAFRDRPDAFDLIITDMTMPSITGDELAREILRLRPALPIVLCTGFSEMINGKKSKEVGIREFLMKPIIKADIAKVVRRVLDQQRS